MIERIANIFDRVCIKILQNKYLRKIVHLFYNRMTRYYHPNNKLIIFGAMNGNWYGDNSRHLFEWVIQNRKDIMPVWVTRNYNLYRRLKSNNLPVVFMYSYVGFVTIMRSRFGFFTDSLRDLFLDPFASHDKIKLIALRHGRSVKRVRFARKRHKITQKEKIERLRESTLIIHAISTSPFVSQMQEECLQIGKNKHIVTGYPRNDELLNSNKGKKIIWKKYCNKLNPNKTILYGPSWRHGRGFTQFFPFNDFDISELIDFLEANKILLLLRPHVTELEKPGLKQLFTELTKQSKYVRLATHKTFPDVNSIIPFIDVLVSDYSALYHDFLLLDKPMMFIPYDYEDFERQNGFLYEYFKYLPGPNVNSFSMFCNEIRKIVEGKDPFLRKRKILLEKIHVFKDANSSKRVVSLFDELINTSQ